MMVYNAFIFLGLIHLFLMLRQDMKKMTIDSRHNRFMTGVAVLMYITNFPGLIIGIAILCLTALFVMFVRKPEKLGMGSADIEMVSWALLGFGTLNLVWAVLYLTWVTILRVMYGVAMRRAGAPKLPATPIFLGAFIATAAMGYFMDLLVYGLI